MTICFFGNYIPDYPRIQVLKKGLVANGVKILECHTRKTGLAKYFELWRQHRRLRDQYDVLLVTMGAYTLVPFARLITKKKLIFDAFVSLNVTAQDRGEAGLSFRFWDKLGCLLADKVLLDTNAHINYFVENYHLDRRKFIRVLVGADDEIFAPSPLPDPGRGALSPARGEGNSERFIVHWHGYIVPFHGLEIVIEAANKLRDYKDIEFRITTRFNSKYEKIKRRMEELALNNIKFYPETSYRELSRQLNESDLSLGVFGTNAKASLVIPNRIYEAVACQVPVITADTSAVREVFDEASMKFCKASDAKALVTAILELYNDKEQRKSLAANAYEIYKTRLTPEIVVKELLTNSRPPTIATAQAVAGRRIGE